MEAELFVEYTREEWGEFRQSDFEFEPVEDLARLVSLNDRLNQQDVQEIYVPLLHYIDLFYRKQKAKHQKQNDFFNHGKSPFTNKIPFIIGISGSVAVGKSTAARVLKSILEQAYPDQKIELMTTDGFLYPNKELKRRGIMSRKGFPESYDMVALLEFMRKVKIGTPKVKYCVYSHEIYDIVEGEYKIMDRPDILIVEGINVFQLPENQEIYVSDFFDFSIYIDADTLNIKTWYLERFLLHLDQAQDDPTSYYHEMSKWDKDKALDYANEVWYTVNLTNLVQYIAPTKSRADVIIHKGEKHYIDKIKVRRY